MTYSTDFIVGTGLRTNLEDFDSGAWTLVSGVAGAAFIPADIGSDGQIRVGTTTTSIYYCPDQGHADQEIIVKRGTLPITHKNTYVALRLADGNNFVGYRVFGTASAGRRLTKVIGGTVTDLITSQGINEEWIKIDAVGDTFRMFTGGTGATPGAWTQIGSDQTVTGLTSTRQGLVVQDNDTAVFLRNFEAASLGATQEEPLLWLPSQFRRMAIAGAMSVSVTLSRPVATISAGTWLPSTGTDLHAMLNHETADLDTWIYATEPTIARLELGNVSLPELAARALKYYAGGTNGGLKVRLYEGVTMIAERTHATLPGTPTQYTMTLTEGELTALTDGTDMFVELEAIA